MQTYGGYAERRQILDETIYNLCEIIHKDLKFKKSMPIKYTETKRDVFFLSVTGDKVDCT